MSVPSGYSSVRLRAIGGQSGKTMTFDSARLVSATMSQDLLMSAILDAGQRKSIKKGSETIYNYDASTGILFQPTPLAIPMTLPE